MAIDILGNCIRSSQVRKELKKRSILRVIVHNGLTPSSSVKWSHRVRQMISSYSLSSILKKLYQRSRQILDPDPAPEVALLSGADGLKDKRVRCVEHKIWAHSFDYDIYLEHNKARQNVSEPYAVFLDEDMVHHSDYDHLGVTPPTSEQAYYSSMNDFFQKLKRDVGVPVIVAAHPRSNYDVRPQLWRSCSITKGKTAQLVRDAALVLCHGSTSVSFAVLWRKPILFLTTNDLIPSYLGPNIALLRSLLRAPLINIDEKNNPLPNIKSLLGVDQAAYANYINEYIKRPGTPDFPVWRIFSEFVQRELSLC